MNKLKSFFATTFLGGFTVILPLVIFFILIKWIIGLLAGLVEPIVTLFPFDLNRILLQVISVAIVIGVCFAIGLVVKTSFGKNIFDFVEETLLSRLPFYSTIKETVQQFFGDKKTAFKQVVLIDPYKTGTRMIGFVTDVNEDNVYTIFVPTAPNPTNGYVYIMNETEIEKVDAKSDAAMRSILGLGTGMNKIIPPKKKDLTNAD